MSFSIFYQIKLVSFSSPRWEEIWKTEQMYNVPLVCFNQTVLCNCVSATGSFGICIHCSISTRIAFKKASNGSLEYDLLSLINLQVKCNIPMLRYNTDILMNNKSVLCTFLSLFSLTTLLFSLTTVHGVVTGQLAPLCFDPWKVWLLFDNICIEYMQGIAKPTN